MSREGSKRFRRLLVAGLAGDSGKTLVSLAILKCLAQRGRKVAGFKKGPDFIDAAWLGRASLGEGRNLDTFLMSKESILNSLRRASGESEFALIEGNRGLFDGLDAEGSHSTAELAKITGSPIVLVVDATKATRTIAALVLGCLSLDPAVPLGGVILNRVGTLRQEKVIREALQRDVGIPVLGAIPRLSQQYLPGRHLGLVTSVEHSDAEPILEGLSIIAEEYLDIPAIEKLSSEVSDLPVPSGWQKKCPSTVRIGVLRDKAFSFYYPENLEALELAGARLVPISPMLDEDLPWVDGLYAGGGFPEIYAGVLSQNQVFRDQLAARIMDGMPVWAECGGLIYLSRNLRMDGETYQMVGALPADVEQFSSPQGHGYVEAKVDCKNDFFPTGRCLTGHEFHYSRVCAGPGNIPTVLDLSRGIGIGRGRDGIQVGSVFASYMHIHALGVRDWAPTFVSLAGGSLEIKH